MRLLSALALLLALTLTACGGERSVVDGYVDEFGGSRAVYERIADQTDCASLQAEYDGAAANHDVLDPSTDEYRWTGGYMAAAEDRMEELECDAPDS